MKIGVIGAGLFGVAAALQLTEDGHLVSLFEASDGIIQNASAVNQARLHNGFHYPRHLPTAIDARNSYGPFGLKYSSSVRQIVQYYGVSNRDSKISGDDFRKFAVSLGVQAEVVDNHPLLPNENLELLIKTFESTFDIDDLRSNLLKELKAQKDIKIYCNTTITFISEKYNGVALETSLNEVYNFEKIIVCSYAHNKRFAEMLNFNLPSTKFQVCEVLLGYAEQLPNEGITIMDGPFWSIMPFGKSGLHSLTHVFNTPLVESVDTRLSCQLIHGKCGKLKTFKCAECEFLPQSQSGIIVNEVSEFTQGKLDFKYQRSLFTLKAVLNDVKMDGRPTISQTTPTGNVQFIFSGKVGDIANVKTFLDC